MAVPIAFPEVNVNWKGGTKDVGDLPAYQFDGVNLSCWKLTWRERFAAFFKGRVWLQVHGAQAPVYLSSQDPFDRSARAAKNESPANQ